MARLKPEKITERDSLGNKWTTRKPKEVDLLLERDVATMRNLGLEEALSNLPPLSQTNKDRLLNGADLQYDGLVDKLKKWGPRDKYGRGLSVAGTAALSGAVAVFSQYIANISARKNVDGSGLARQVNEWLRNLTPEMASEIMNALNKSLFQGLTWFEYENPAIGLMKTISLSAFIFAIGGMGTYKLTNYRTIKKELEQRIADGVEPYPRIGHVVVYGGEGPLMSAKIDGETLTQKLVGSREIVLVQKEGQYSNPGSAGAEFNKGKYYVNLAKLDDGTPQRQDLAPTIVSGAYKAGAILINAQEGIGLFEDATVDSSASKQVDLSLGECMVRFARLMRGIVYENPQKLKAVVVVPQYYAINDLFRESQEDPYLNTMRAFSSSAREVDGAVIPEQVFLEMAFKELMARDMLGQPLYLDLGGEKDADKRAANCRVALESFYAKRGVEVPRMHTDPQEAREARNSIIIRDDSSNLQMITAANARIFDSGLVLYSAPTRTRSEQDVMSGNTIPIRYKEGVARKILDVLK